VTGPRGGDLDGVTAEVRQPEILQQQAAVGVRARAHPAIAPWRQRSQRPGQRSAGVEQFLRPVTAQPPLELGQMIRVGADVGQRDLV